MPERAVALRHCVFPCISSFFIKGEPGSFENQPPPASPVFLSRAPRCGSLGLLVLVNVILALALRLFVFHHAALSAHPLRQPASLLPGINRPAPLSHRTRLSCLSVVPLPASANPAAVHGAQRPAQPPSKGLKVILRPAGHPHCAPFDMAGLPPEQL